MHWAGKTCFAMPALLRFHSVTDTIWHDYRLEYRNRTITHFTFYSHSVLQLLLDAFLCRYYPVKNTGVGGAVRFLVVGTIGQEE